MTTPNTLIEGQHQLITFSTGKSFPIRFLRDALPDVATAMFFAKAYNLSPTDLANLLREVVPGDVAEALLSEASEHSTTLQDYLLATYVDEHGEWFVPEYTEETGTVDQVQAEILPEVWKNLELEIADSIQQVADKLRDTVAQMPGKTGEMVFQTLAKVNAKRPTIGDYRAGIKRHAVKRVLVVFDTSGSMSEPTVETIVDDVVGLAYEANASLAIVSNTCTYWDAGAFGTKDVLAAAEYGGTHYEQLAPLFTGQDWDIVITVADYDSAWSAKSALSRCDGKIGQVLDISLVDRSTYLAECVGQLADEVRPILIANRNLCW